jgi:hypothetical protein
MCSDRVMMAASDAYRCRLRITPPRYHCSWVKYSTDSYAPTTLVLKKMNSQMPLTTTIQKK